MLTEDQILQQNEARLQLAEYKRIADDRDRRIRHAKAAGLTLAEIGRLTGLSRNYIGKLTGER